MRERDADKARRRSRATSEKIDARPHLLSRGDGRVVLQIRVAVVVAELLLLRERLEQRVLVRGGTLGLQAVVGESRLLLSDWERERLRDGPHHRRSGRGAVGEAVVALLLELELRDQLPILKENRRLVVGHRWLRVLKHLRSQGGEYGEHVVGAAINRSTRAINGQIATRGRDSQQRHRKVASWEMSRRFFVRREACGEGAQGRTVCQMRGTREGTCVRPLTRRDARGACVRPLSRGSAEEHRRRSTFSSSPWVAGKAREEARPEQRLRIRLRRVREIYGCLFRGLGFGSEKSSLHARSSALCSLRSVLRAGGGGKVQTAGCY